MYTLYIHTCIYIYIYIYIKTETKNDLIAIMERVKLASEKAGLFLNVGKTKVMMTED